MGRRPKRRRKHHIHRRGGSLPKRGTSLQLNGTSIQKALFTLVMSIVSLFFFISILTAFGPGYSLSSDSINDASKNISKELFVSIMGMENPYFTQALPEDYSPPSVSAAVFELATSIDPGDHRTLLGRELPGFAQFDGRILVAGEGVDYTNMPIESSPPMDVLMAEREAATERLDEMDQIREEMGGSEGEIEVLDNIVHIIHSHNRESYLPELTDEDDPNRAFHDSVNITLVGERLGLELRKYGIGSEVDNSDINAKLNERGWQYGQSYNMAREVLTEAIEEHGEFEYYFDLHRDSQPREVTTAEINGENYAQILFVVGGGNPNHEQNLALMEKLHRKIEDKKPGLSRGVFDPSGPGRNGVYNQDISPNSILIEFGGVGNTLEEVYRSVEVFAEVFSDYYWEINEDRIVGTEKEEE
ncbi:MULTISPECIES: stage II sporulation protein P [Bacillaceae]|uniref:Stage II sporulation protein P n=1 Tax=Evansella alkalicola TaxID=745819 RepID=A0ABS6JWR6_9BACI|nr:MULTISPECIES: stage II sporulation protein P [Bacillaceae]MBU9722521.1 stage II sporulation protein P [Bacillus alkalicola]